MGVTDMGMYPHTVTRWRLVEDGRSASWERSVIGRCRWSESGESSEGTGGDTSSRSAAVILPPSEEPPLSRHDRVALGDVAEAEPSADALAVTSCRPVFLAGPRPHHWEASAR